MGQKMLLMDSGCQFGSKSSTLVKSSRTTQNCRTATMLLDLVKARSSYEVLLRYVYPCGQKYHLVGKNCFRPVLILRWKIWCQFTASITACSASQVATLMAFFPKSVRLSAICLILLTCQIFKPILFRFDFLQKSKFVNNNFKQFSGSILAWFNQFRLASQKLAIHRPC